MRTLVVAEKPSVGADIARVLGCKTKTQGSIAGDNYVVSWAIGHLIGLFEPEEYDDAYKKWTAESLPILPPHLRLKALPKTKSQLAVLKSLMNILKKETEADF